MSKVGTRRICRCMLALIGRVGLLGAILSGMLLERRRIGMRRRLARGAFWQERTRAKIGLRATMSPSVFFTFASGWLLAVSFVDQEEYLMTLNVCDLCLLKEAERSVQIQSLGIGFALCTAAILLRTSWCGSHNVVVLVIQILRAAFFFC